MHFKFPLKWLLPIVPASALLLAACAVRPIQPQTPVAETPATGIAAMATVIAEATTLLSWQGPAEPGGPNTTQCASLRVAGEQAMMGTCDGAIQTLPLGARYAQEWAEIQERFAPFVYETPTEKLDFNGAGTLAGDAWQRALAAWARARYAELSSGKVSASVNTAVSWYVGQLMDRKDACMHLTVLTWGYAYADTTSCEGSDVRESASGWLETAELEQLDPWLYERAALYQENNYIAGTGEQPMSEAEIAQAEQWAAAVWARLAATNSTAQPAGCPTVTPDTQLLVDEAHGYCLLYPADYTAAQTSPNETNLVRGSLMNHIDPRVSIAVEDAAGRTLTQVGDQLEADYAPVGSPIERGTATVDGVDALVLDNLPGQDLNRRVAFIHDGRLYSLFFTPLGETHESRAQMETFYQGVLDSFRFLEASVPPATPDPAGVEVAPAGVQYVLALFNVNIRSGPGTDYDVIGKVFAGQTALVTGATGDSQWWRVSCPDDSIGSCWVSADPTLTQPITAP